MPRKPSLSEQLAEIITRLSGDPRRPPGEKQSPAEEAFLAAVADMRQGVDMAALRSAILAREDAAINAALNIDGAELDPFIDVLRQGFNEAGRATAAALPQPPRNRAPPLPPQPPPGSPPGTPAGDPTGGRIVFRWSVQDPASLAIIDTQAADLVTRVTDETRQVVRTAISDGFQKGEHPDTIARRIAGTTNRITGQREGGVIGLTEPQERYVASMRERLKSGTPDDLRYILGIDRDGKATTGGMKRRDKRFDATIRKAIASGDPIPAAMIEKMTSRYTERLVALRAETIARTETGQSVMAARHREFQRGLVQTGYPEEAVTKTWRHSAQDDGRPQHAAMHNKMVQGMTAEFVLPDGTRMQHPLDIAGGAKHNANCRCVASYKIDYSWGLD